jgi:hypothetical protein
MKNAAIPPTTRTPPIMSGRGAFFFSGVEVPVAMRYVI